MEKNSKYDCIILAAGLSSRMGRWKMSLPWKNGTVLEYSLSAALAHTKRIILIGGHNSEEIDRLVSPLKIEKNKLLILENRDYRTGMISSVKCALDHINSDAFFITLGDLPLIDPFTYNLLENSPFEKALFPTFGGRRGHPVLVSSTLKDQILNLPLDGRMKDILNGEGVNELEVDDRGILCDLDTEEDYERLRR